MNILDEARAQNREIVTRDGRKPEWVQRGGEKLYYYVTKDECCWESRLDGTRLPGYTGSHDLILAPKKAALWYAYADGRIIDTCGSSPENESILRNRYKHRPDVSIHSAIVDLP